MADVAGPSFEGNIPDNNAVDEENNEVEEPLHKKQKTSSNKKAAYNLEDRLNGILCCAVCLDLPMVAVYQCNNGHLMCAGCFSHLLADARLKDESATCPNCRCELNKNQCSRNLAVEKAISELPAECQFCLEQLPRSGLEYHERELCQERLVSCRYERIGCPWRGPFHELQGHSTDCTHPKKTGDEILESLQVIDKKREAEMMLYQSIFNLLSFEKIAFSDLQLRPYRTDDYLPRLYYETSRFTAFNNQWVVKAYVNDNKKDPNLSAARSLGYQVVSKSKLGSPLRLHYVALQGPYGDTHIDPAIHEFEFSSENNETALKELPLKASADCNKLLAAKTVNMRLIMFQVAK